MIPAIENCDEKQNRLINGYVRETESSLQVHLSAPDNGLIGIASHLFLSRYLGHL